MKEDWIEAILEPVRLKTERLYETSKRLTINNVEQYLKDGLKTCEEVQAAYYGLVMGMESGSSMWPLVELWIDEYFEELEDRGAEG